MSILRIGLLFLGLPGGSDSKESAFNAGESESERRSVVSDSLQLHGLYSPWNSLGQNTGVEIPSPGYLPNPGIEPRSPALQAGSLPVWPQGNAGNQGSIHG